MMGMAKEVASGQASVLRQYEFELQKEIAERSNMENQASFVLRTADLKMQAIENIAEQAQAKSAEYSQLLSDSVSAVYTLEDQNAKLQSVVCNEAEEVQYRNRRHDDARRALQETTAERSALQMRMLTIGDSHSHVISE
ncbi:MAG: hypothetical protein ACKPKO_16630, partial [Candidatus Fonsibacter sp.]